MIELLLLSLLRPISSLGTLHRSVLDCIYNTFRLSIYVLPTLTSSFRCTACSSGKYFISMEEVPFSTAYSCHIGFQSILGCRMLVSIVVSPELIYRTHGRSPAKHSRSCRKDDAGWVRYLPDNAISTCRSCRSHIRNQAVPKPRKQYRLTESCSQSRFCILPRIICTLHKSPCSYCTVLLLSLWELWSSSHHPSLDCTSLLAMPTCCAELMHHSDRCDCVYLAMVCTCIGGDAAMSMKQDQNAACSSMRIHTCQQPSILN
jgi:hypothetical protein